MALGDFFGRLSSYIVTLAERYRESQRRERLRALGLNGDKITSSVVLRNPENITIGPNTYMNSGQLFAGKEGQDNHRGLVCHRLQCPYQGREP